MVSTAESANSGSPVARVKVSASKSSWWGCRPYSPQAISWMRRAARSLVSRVFAIPPTSGELSMVSAITAAPWSRTSGSTASQRPRPLSRLTEFTTARPG